MHTSVVLPVSRNYSTIKKAVNPTPYLPHKLAERLRFQAITTVMAPIRTTHMSLHSVEEICAFEVHTFENAGSAWYSQIQSHMAY